MNERIQELMEQSGISFHPMIVNDVEYEYDHVHLDDNIGGDEAGCIKKFAELIVRECVYVAREVGDLRGANDDMIYGADTAAVLILKHFGVE